MSESHVWLSSDATALVLDELRQVAAEVTAMVHQAGGDDRREIRQVLLQVAFLLTAAEQRLKDRFADPGVPGEVGQVTADVVRRMRRNSGGTHRRSV